MTMELGKDIRLGCLLEDEDLRKTHSLDDGSIELLHRGFHSDPFSVLGCHVMGESHMLVRVWEKDACSVKMRLAGRDTDAADKKRRGESITWSFADSSTTSVNLVKRADWLFEGFFSFFFNDITTTELTSCHDDVVENEDENTSATSSSVTRTSPPLSPKKMIFSIPRYELLVKYNTDEENDDKEESYFVKHDAYSFGLLLRDTDLQKFQSGSCWHVDALLGSHVDIIHGVRGTRFALWAPNACFVSVVGDWNQWDGRAHPMRRRHSFGVWELFIPPATAGMKYGYRIHTSGGTDVIKIDPFAQEFENPPSHASIISMCDDDAKRKMGEKAFQWTDEKWMTERKEHGEMDVVRRQPMSIYEVHLPSWMRGNNNAYLGYREMAERLVTHVKNLNFTHVEFLPLAWHPFEGSWGYQTMGLYAPYSRLGTGDDLKYLIDALHAEGIGVLLDFVPGHFAKDDWGLVCFDGAPLFEYADPREGEHREWGTMVFNFRRSEVRSFLLGAAYHWLRRYHVDGLRIDAVSSMLYRNHQRPAGQWVPNEHGGDSNLEAISLLQELNWVVRNQFPGVFMMAEESTAWRGVTDRENNGLGFDAKWDLGWMNDTLSYLCTPFDKRSQKHSKLTFRGLYLAHEKWILPLSHDEVVSGKGSLLDKCGYVGTDFEERLKGLRTLMGFQIGSPGRPLIFMGGEFGQGREWIESRSIDWHEAAEDYRSKCCTWVSDLLAVYRYHRALHAGDDELWNFQWIDCDNAQDNVIAFLRRYAEWFNDIIVICNFSGSTYSRYPVGCPHGGEWTVLLNSDDWRYAGSMQGPGNLSRLPATQGGRIGWDYSLWVDVPAFGCLYLKAPEPHEEATSCVVVIKE